MHVYVVLKKYKFKECAITISYQLLLPSNYRVCCFKIRRNECFECFPFFFVIVFRLIIKGKLILSLLFANLLQMLTAGSSMTSKRWSSLALSKCVHLSRWTLGSAEQRRYKKHQIITRSHTLLILSSLSKKKKPINRRSRTTY